MTFMATKVRVAGREKKPKRVVVKSCGNIQQESGNTMKKERGYIASLDVAIGSFTTGSAGGHFTTGSTRWKTDPVVDWVDQFTNSHPSRLGQNTCKLLQWYINPLTARLRAPLTAAGIEEAEVDALAAPFALGFPLHPISLSLNGQCSFAGDDQQRHDS